MYDLLDTPRYYRNETWGNSKIRILYNRMTSEWHIDNKSNGKYTVTATKSYGTSRMDAYTIIENTLKAGASLCTIPRIPSDASAAAALSSTPLTAPDAATAPCSASWTASCCSLTACIPWTWSGASAAGPARSTVRLTR